VLSAVQLVFWFTSSSLYSSTVLAISLTLSTVGLLTGLLFFSHNNRIVFNRRPRFTYEAVSSMMQFIRPLELVWRFCTATLRCTPDFYILGEVRTGTTTLSAHCKRLGCIGPFAPWIHPLASEKESFYFCGHYWGYVNPSMYRMCFPLKITKWFYTQVLGRPFIVFDGCASYLNTPWCAALIRKATPDAKLIVCLREPASQNVSWVKLESGTAAWAKSMGLGEDYLPMGGIAGYPPADFDGIVQLSQQGAVAKLYKEAELLGESGWIPEKYLVMPGGQLAALVRCM
jgi:hypothetical protein